MEITQSKEREMRNLRLSFFLLLAVLITLLAACGGSNPVENSKQPVTTENNQVQDQNLNAEEPINNQVENQIDYQNEDQADAEDPNPQFQPLPVSQQQVEIITEDGRLLEGLYYPAKIPDAPVVVLLHWAPGSMDDWMEIARWLQNRLDEIGMEDASPIILTGNNSKQTEDWTDRTWFPPMPEEASFAVLAFNFGAYGNSAGKRATWLVDAQAGVRFAASLPGVNPHQISALGASIGADGAADGCYLFNDLGEMGTCIGAFSLSPGNYLTNDFSYGKAVSMLDQEGHPVWCLAAEDDGDSPTACLSAEGNHYRSFIYPGNFHGMRLIEQYLYPLEPPVDFDTLQLVQEWLEEVYLLTLNQFSLE
jgi:dienelactone hydrolase